MLGAGANQLLLDDNRIRPPMARNLFEVAEALQRFSGSRANEYSSLFAYIAQFWHRERDWLTHNSFDLEECLSLIDDQLREAEEGPYRTYLGRARFQLISLLAGTLAEYRSHPQGSSFEPFAYLCELMRCGVVITFNYDCLVEGSLQSSFVTRRPSHLPTWPSSVIDEARSRVGDWTADEISWWMRDVFRLAHYGIDFDDVLVHFPGRPLEFMPMDLFRPHIPAAAPILKIHGSLNWWRCVAREPHSTDASSFDRRDRLILAPESHWNWHGASAPTGGGWVLDPVVVPPTASKSDILDFPVYRALFRSIWHRATEALHECSRVVLIG